MMLGCWLHHFHGFRGSVMVVAEAEQEKFEEVPISLFIENLWQVSTRPQTAVRGFILTEFLEMTAPTKSISGTKNSHLLIFRNKFFSRHHCKNCLMHDW
jgi:hypothetical protein